VIWCGIAKLQELWLASWRSWCRLLLPLPRRSCLFWIAKNSHQA